MKYFKEHKKFTYFYGILILLSIISIIFTYNNYELYDYTIAKITNINVNFLLTFNKNLVFC